MYTPKHTTRVLCAAYSESKTSLSLQLVVSSLLESQVLPFLLSINLPQMSHCIISSSKSFSGTSVAYYRSN